MFGLGELIKASEEAVEKASENAVELKNELDKLALEEQQKIKKQVFDALGPLGEMIKKVTEDGKGLLKTLLSPESMTKVGLHIVHSLLKKLAVPMDAVFNAIEGLVAKLLGITIKTPLVSLISSAPGGAFVAMPVAETVVADISHVFSSIFLKVMASVLQDKLEKMLVAELMDPDFGKGLKELFTKKLYPFLNGLTGKIWDFFKHIFGGEKVNLDKSKSTDFDFDGSKTASTSLQDYSKTAPGPFKKKKEEESRRSPQENYNLFADLLDEKGKAHSKTAGADANTATADVDRAKIASKHIEACGKDIAGKSQGKFHHDHLGLTNQELIEVHKGPDGGGRTSPWQFAKLLQTKIVKKVKTFFMAMINNMESIGKTIFQKMLSPMFACAQRMVLAVMEVLSAAVMIPMSFLLSGTVIAFGASVLVVVEQWAVPFLMPKFLNKGGATLSNVLKEEAASARKAVEEFWTTRFEDLLGNILKTSFDSGVFKLEKVFTEHFKGMEDKIKEGEDKIKEGAHIFVEQLKKHIPTTSHKYIDKVVEKIKAKGKPKRIV